MNKFVEQLKDKITVKWHGLVVDSSNALAVLQIIDDYSNKFVNGNLSVTSLNPDGKGEWYIAFNASTEQWRNIVRKLTSQQFTLFIRDETDDIFVTRKIEA